MTGVVAIAAGLSFLTGILTPLASLLIMLAGLIFTSSWIPFPSANLFENKLVTLFVVAIAMAVALLGPGAFSFDALLFGRREIFIPADRSPKQ
jgi:uncharacterized membrane protein YphA (DoxX/SURF4 family)